MNKLPKSLQNHKISKIDPVFKEKWLTELRSGQYKQGKKLLRSLQDDYCCLGIACEIVKPESGRHCDTKNAYEYENLYFSISDNMKKQTGLTLDIEYILSSLNDYDNWTFPQIADWIEENL